MADVTYGRGAFWRKVALASQTLLASDRYVTPQGRACAVLADFRALPYRRDSLDLVVFDPPYVHNPGTFMTQRQYNNASTRGMNHKAILELYREGMAEAAHVLKPGGQLWVKCKDEIESGIQRWSHLEIYAIAMALGFLVRDLFVLIPTSRTSERRWQRQIHARKNHSYLLVLKKRT
jgi:methylase of polypeptide subunit release factors